MKKTVLLFVTLLSVTLTNAQLAAGATFSDSLYNYSVTTADEAGSPNTVSITSTVTGATVPNDVVVPASVTEGGTEYAITLLASTVFKGSAITSAVLEGETAIGFQTFMDAKSLTSVSAPLSTEVFNQSFRGCAALTNVNIPKVVSIGIQSFRACTSLKTIDLPSTTTIGTSTGQGLTFWQSTALETINMPVLDSISVGAFNGCAALKSITFPASTTKIDNTNHNMFKGCTSLENVIIEYTTFIDLTYNEDTTSVNSSIFVDVAPNATLTVPSGMQSLYMAGDVWKDFSSFAESAELSIHSAEAALGWNVYATQNTVSITNDEGKSAEVVIYDITGKTLLTTSVGGTESEVNTSGLASGVYVVKAETEKGIFTKKFVKQ